MQEMQDMQGLKYMQDIHGMKYMQGVQHIQGMQDKQSIQHMQDIQHMQGIQHIQDIQHMQYMQGMQDVQGIQSIQGIQGIQSIQGIRGIQDFQGIQGIQDIRGIQNMQDMQYIQSMQGMQLQGIDFEHQVDVDSVTSTNVKSTNVISTNVKSTNVEFTDALKKQVIKKKRKHGKNHGDKGAATSSPILSKDKMAADKASTDNKFLKEIIKNLISDLKLHRHVKKIRLDTFVKRVEMSIICTNKLKLINKDIYVKNNRILLLFLYVKKWVSTLNVSDQLDSVSKFLNSLPIFNACFACLLAAYDSRCRKEKHILKKMLSEKRNIVSEVMETFCNIDKENTGIYVKYLKYFHYLYYHPHHRESHNCVFQCVLKWVFCSLQANSPFNNMQENLNKYHKRLESLFTFSKEVAKISKDKEKGTYEKIQILKRMVESYVKEIKSFINALEDEQKNLMKEVSHSITNMTQLVTFAFYRLGKLLLLILSWNQKHEQKFLFVMNVFNQLVIECDKYINCNSDLTEEISALLTQKQCWLQALFGNMFLRIYKALISPLKLIAESILNKINENAKELEILDATAILEMTENLEEEVQTIEISQFSILIDIHYKKEQLGQDKMFFKLREINNKVKTLSNKVKKANYKDKTKILKENASTILEIVTEFNSLFDIMGIEPLKEEKLEQLKEYVQNLESISTSCKSDNQIQQTK